jgi:hypothetical protein
MFKQMFNMVNHISARLDAYMSGVRFKMGVMSVGKMRLSDNCTPTIACVGAQRVAPMFSVMNMGREFFMVTEAAATGLCHFGGKLPTSRRASAKIAPRQFAPVLSPPLCQCGGASRVCRRFLWRKSCNTVAAPVLAAVHFGDNFACFAHVFHNNFVSS